jgi:hypothetical protein
MMKKTVEFSPGQILDVTGFVLPPLLVLKVLKPEDSGYKQTANFFGHLYLDERQRAIIVTLPLGEVNTARLNEGKFLFMDISAIATSAKVIAVI